MDSCELCNKSGHDLSLREAYHKEMGKKWVCKECWTELFTKNKIVTGSSGGVSGCNLGCPGCRNS